MPNEGPWITKTIIELEERIAELERMVKVFRGCIDTQVLPGQGSLCHKIVYDLVGAPDDGGVMNDLQQCWQKTKLQPKESRNEN